MQDSPGVMRDDYVTSVVSQHESMLCGVASHSNGTYTSACKYSLILTAPVPPPIQGRLVFSNLPFNWKQIHEAVEGLG